MEVCLCRLLIVVTSGLCLLLCGVAWLLFVGVIRRMILMNVGRPRDGLDRRMSLLMLIRFCSGACDLVRIILLSIRFVVLIISRLLYLPV